MNFNLSEELVNRILGYLGNRPYVETNELITEIQSVCAEQLNNPYSGTATGEAMKAKKTKNIA